jgi:hypothetical protein
MQAPLELLDRFWPSLSVLLLAGVGGGLSSGSRPRRKC